MFFREATSLLRRLFVMPITVNIIFGYGLSITSLSPFKWFVEIKYSDAKKKCFFENTF